MGCLVARRTIWTVGADERYVPDKGIILDGILTSATDGLSRGRTLARHCHGEDAYAEGRGGWWWEGVGGCGRVWEGVRGGLRRTYHAESKCPGELVVLDGGSPSLVFPVPIPKPDVRSDRDPKLDDRTGVLIPMCGVPHLRSETPIDEVVLYHHPGKVAYRLPRNHVDKIDPAQEGTGLDLNGIVPDGRVW